MDQLQNYYHGQNINMPIIDANDQRIIGRPGYGRRPYGYGYGYGRPYGRRPYYGAPFVGGLLGGLLGGALLSPYGYGYPPPYYPYYPYY